MAGAPGWSSARATVYTTWWSRVPPWSGCGWQTTAKALTGCGPCTSVAGVSMSACRGPAGPSRRVRSACGGRSTRLLRRPRPPAPRGAPAGGRFPQALAEASFADALPERVLDALEQSLALLELGIVLLAVDIARQCAELQVPARGILEALALVGLELAHHPFVDALGEQQH